MRDVELIRERWVLWFHTLLNTKSPKLDPKIAEAFGQWPVNIPLGVQPMMQVGPDGIPVELFKITLNGDPALRQRLLDIITGIWRGKRFRNSGKMPLSRCSTRRRIGQNVETTGVSHWWCTLERYCSRSSLVASVITASV